VSDREDSSASAPAQQGPREDLEADLIVERLSWTPRERLRYLTDMLEFEERARRARPVGKAR